MRFVLTSKKLLDSFVEKCLGLRSELLIEDEFFVDMSLLVLRVHLLLFIHEEHALHLPWIKEDLFAKTVGVLRIALEQDHSRPVLSLERPRIGRRLPYEASVNLLAIDLKLVFIDPT